MVVGTVGILLYVIPIYAAGLTQGLMWRAYNQDGTLTYSFIESVSASHAGYIVRVIGGGIFFAGMLLMAYSNKFHSLLLTTGNKSELATGYCTLYGDMCGGYSVLKDVYKMMVYKLSNWRNQNQPKGALGPAGRAIPERIITKAPTAELRPDLVPGAGVIVGTPTPADTADAARATGTKLVLLAEQEVRHATETPAIATALAYQTVQAATQAQADARASADQWYWRDLFWAVAGLVAAVAALIITLIVKGVKIVPLCPFVNAQRRRHPEWADVFQG